MFLIKLKWLEFKGDKYVKKAEKFPIDSVGRTVNYSLARSYYQEGLDLVKHQQDNPSRLEKWLRTWVK